MRRQREQDVDGESEAASNRKEVKVSEDEDVQQVQMNSTATTILDAGLVPMSMELDVSGNTDVHTVLEGGAGNDEYVADRPAIEYLRVPGAGQRKEQLKANKVCALLFGSKKHVRALRLAAEGTSYSQLSSGKRTAVVNATAAVVEKLVQTLFGDNGEEILFDVVHKLSSKKAVKGTSADSLVKTMDKLKGSFRSVLSACHSKYSSEVRRTTLALLSSLPANVCKEQFFNLPSGDVFQNAQWKSTGALDMECIKATGRLIDNSQTRQSVPVPVIEEAVNHILSEQFTRPIAVGTRVISYDRKRVSIPSITRRERTTVMYLDYVSTLKKKADEKGEELDKKKCLSFTSYKRITRSLTSKSQKRGCGGDSRMYAHGHMMNYQFQSMLLVLREKGVFPTEGPDSFEELVKWRSMNEEFIKRDYRSHVAATLPRSQGEVDLLDSDEAVVVPASHCPSWATTDKGDVCKSRKGYCLSCASAFLLFDKVDLLVRNHNSYLEEKGDFTFEEDFKHIVETLLPGFRESTRMLMGHLMRGAVQDARAAVHVRDMKKDDMYLIVDYKQKIDPTKENGEQLHIFNMKGSVNYHGTLCITVKDESVSTSAKDETLSMTNLLSSGRYEVIFIDAVLLVDKEPDAGLTLSVLEATVKKAKDMYPHTKRVRFQSDGSPEYLPSSLRLALLVICDVYSLELLSYMRTEPHDGKRKTLLGRHFGEINQKMRRYTEREENENRSDIMFATDFKVVLSGLQNTVFIICGFGQGFNSHVHSLLTGVPFRKNGYSNKVPADVDELNLKSNPSTVTRPSSRTLQEDEELASQILLQRYEYHMGTHILNLVNSDVLKKDLGAPSHLREFVFERLSTDYCDVTCSTFRHSADIREMRSIRLTETSSCRGIMTLSKSMATSQPDISMVGISGVRSLTLVPLLPEEVMSFRGKESTSKEEVQTDSLFSFPDKMGNYSRCGTCHKYFRKHRVAVHERSCKKPYVMKDIESTGKRIATPLMRDRWKYSTECDDQKRGDSAQVVRSSSVISDPIHLSDRVEMSHMDGNYLERCFPRGFADHEKSPSMLGVVNDFLIRRSAHHWLRDTAIRSHDTQEEIYQAETHSGLPLFSSAHVPSLSSLSTMCKTMETKWALHRNLFRKFLDSDGTGLVLDGSPDLYSHIELKVLKDSVFEALEMEVERRRMTPVRKKPVKLFKTVIINGISTHLPVMKKNNIGEETDVQDTRPMSNEEYKLLLWDQIQQWQRDRYNVLLGEHLRMCREKYGERFGVAGIPIDHEEAKVDLDDVHLVSCLLDYECGRRMPKNIYIGTSIRTRKRLFAQFHCLQGKEDRDEASDESELEEEIDDRKSEMEEGYERFIQEVGGSSSSGESSSEEDEVEEED